MRSNNPVDTAIEHYKDSIRSRNDLTPTQKSDAIRKYEDKMRKNGILTKDAAYKPHKPG